MIYNLGVVCERLGEKGGAIEQYKHYLEIKADDADVWNQIGVLYDETGSKKEARAAYEKALGINPKFGRAHHNLGVLLKEAGGRCRSHESKNRIISGTRSRCGPGNDVDGLMCAHGPMSSSRGACSAANVRKVLLR